MLSIQKKLAVRVPRVTGSTRISFPERIATSQALNGHRISVEIPTHVAGVLDFAGGTVATLITSFDVWTHNLPRIEIYGSEGSLSEMGGTCDSADSADSAGGWGAGFS